MKNNVSSPIDDFIDGYKISIQLNPNLSKQAKRAFSNRMDLAKHLSKASYTLLQKEPLRLSRYEENALLVTGLLFMLSNRRSQRW